MKLSRIDEMICRQEHLSSLNRQLIEEIQLKKINDLLVREKARAGFYANLPEKLSSLDELASLPFTTEEDLAQNAGKMLLVSQSDIQRILSDATSGTTGLPKRVFYTLSDCKNTIELYKAGLGEFVFPGSKTLICMPFSGPYGLGELISSAIEELGATPLKAGIGMNFGQLEALILQEKPDTFVGMPSHLYAILTVLGPLSLQRALISGDACPVAVTKQIETILGSKLFPHYGSREMGMAGAITCPAHKGMHLRENHIIAEIIDEAGNCLPYGEEGELVITTIGMEAMPLIRYRTGDYTRILPEKCACGSETVRLDLLRRKGNPGKILSLDEKLFSMNGLVDYRASVTEGVLSFDILATPIFNVQKLERMFPESVLHLQQVTKEHGPMYSGKRMLLN